MWRLAFIAIRRSRVPVDRSPQPTGIPPSAPVIGAAGGLAGGAAGAAAAHRGGADLPLFERVWRSRWNPAWIPRSRDIAEGRLERICTGDRGVGRSPGVPLRVRLEDGYPVAAITSGELAARYHGDCAEPWYLYFWAMSQSRPHSGTRYGGGSVEVSVRCRGCDACLEARRCDWFGRACREVVGAVKAGERAWVVTGTFRDVPPDEASVREEIKRFLKRLRVGLRAGIVVRGRPTAVPPARVRFLATVERGEGGRLHCHVLVTGDCNWVQLSTAWRAGFVKSKLVRVRVRNGWLDAPSAKAVGYVVKYLVKQKGRLQASTHYGKGAALPVPRPGESAPGKSSLAIAEPEREAGPPGRDLCPPGKPPVVSPATWGAPVPVPWGASSAGADARAAETEPIKAKDRGSGR